jgi:hypothetical protein
MYDFIDRPVTALDPGGRFLVWTLRNWVRASTEGRCPAAAVGPAFAKWHMMGAFPAFHRMLSLINAHGSQTFCVAPVDCRTVTEHEALFLALVNGLEKRKPALLRDTIAMMIEDEHVGGILAAVSMVGGAMKEVGIFPQPPHAVPDAAARRGGDFH